jgi:putative membrane protein
MRSMTEFPLVNAVIFALLGLAVFSVGTALALRLMPFDLRKQIVEEHNVAAAIVAAAVLLGMAWIIAATMH